MKKLAGLISIVFFAGACQGVPLVVGQTEERSCSTYISYEQSDQHTVTLNCDGELYLFTCPDGLAIPTKVDADTLKTDCGSNTEGPPVQEDFEEDLTRGTTIETASTYCSGGHGWQAKKTFQDRQGKRPDSSGDQLNWRIEIIVTWCVIGGAVQCGMSFVDIVTEGRMHEKNDRTSQVTPCGTARRDLTADWDFEYGFCPWCVGIDADLSLWVSGWGTYGGSFTHNGDGY